jgi:hypothetical protein
VYVEPFVEREKLLLTGIIQLTPRRLPQMQLADPFHSAIRVGDGRHHGNLFELFELHLEARGVLRERNAGLVPRDGVGTNVRHPKASAIKHDTDGLWPGGVSAQHLPVTGSYLCHRVTADVRDPDVDAVECQPWATVT